MTAIAIVRTEDVIAIASDGAAYDYAGVLRQIVPKVSLYPHMPLVIAGSGSQLLPKFFEDELLWEPEPPWTFDQLLGIAGRFTASAMERVREMSVPSSWRSTLMLCGYSAERDRLETYAIKTYQWADGTPAFEPVPLPAVYLALAPEAEIGKRFGIAPLDTMSDMPADPYSYAQRAVVACRFCFGGADEEQANQDPHCCVGGFLQLTSITKVGMTSQVTHRWPDVLHERIDVQRGELHEHLPLWLMPPEFFQPAGGAA